jgi:chemotaxis signal transduction protein
MVDIAKIRKKAKEKRVGAGVPAGPAAGTAATTPAPEERLQQFLATAGTKRFEHVVALAAPPDQIELLTFILGGEQYAIDIDRIVEIISARRITRVPNAGPAVTGIISLRGSVVTLIDIRSKLRQPPADGREDSRIIVIEEGGTLIGFEVDRVLRPAKIDRAAIEPQPVVDAAEQSEAIRGVHRSGDALTIVLDLGKLLAA